ncbi:hypothetical protein [Streptomyces sp. NPDC020742]|uniref:hypothetical protein n=1 Tax=Streptomyces sp. NPDC020742 TaxID=3154897 RepID=UPI0033EB80F0
MTSRVLRKAAVSASGALLLGGLAVAPALAAPSSGVSTVASDHGCSKGRNLTNGWGQCTGRGTYYWHVEVDCTLGGWGSSSTQAGRGKTYAYCNWGDVETVKIITES